MFDRRCLAVWLVSLAACASMSRTAALRNAMATEQIRQPLETVWPNALRLLQERDFPLIGKDRVVAGGAEQSGWTKIFSWGFETRRSPDGRMIAETDYDNRRLRYRVEGIPSSDGCRIIFTAIQGSVDTPDEQTRVDAALGLELMRRVDADAAARVDANVEAAARH